MGTGARGLRTVCERLLTETMFEAPGSSIRYVLVTERVAKREAAPVYMARGQQHKFHGVLAQEEEEWEARMKEEKGEGGGGGAGGGGGGSGSDGDGDGGGGAGGVGDGSSASFEEYREKSKAAGFV